MKPKQLDEVLHVYDSHTANGLFMIEGDEDEYSREELLSMISEARDEMIWFKTEWLLPILEELKEFRRIENE